MLGAQQPFAFSVARGEKPGAAVVPDRCVSGAPPTLKYLKGVACIEFGVFPAIVHRPEPAKPLGQKTPLLLFLHGAAMQGDDARDLLGEKAAGYPPRLLLEEQAPAALAGEFTLVAPETNHGWNSNDILALLDILLSEKSGLNLDKERLYVVGHSMGAMGALAAGTTGRFAAVAAIAPPSAPGAAQLRDVPVWAFHAKNDRVASYDTSSRLIGDLRANGATEEGAKLTLYAQAPAAFGMPSRVGHGSYFPAIMEPELYEWLLRQHRKAV